MLMSIVIPTCNQSFALDLTLFWLTNTLPEHTEIIVIDDGSVEDIQSVVKNYQTEFPILYNRIAHMGRAAARNMGVSLSKGKRILFNDSDRFPANSNLKLHRDGKDILIGGIKEFYFSQPEKEKNAIKNNFEGLESKSRIPYYSKIIKNNLFDINGSCISNVPWISFLSGNVSVPRENFFQVGGFDENFIDWGVEHFELGYRFFLAGAKFKQIDTTNYHIAHSRSRHFYRSHLSSSFRYFKNKHRDQTVVMFEKFMFGIASLQEVELSTLSNNNNNKNKNLWVMGKESEPIMMPRI
ncbi:glycosyltransferase [Paenibacillus sp. IB182496]|uniref:Glycosyltransferase n=1 Tax=Paenibacillus sabuli TaxID=2772509 RepID=A0A927BY54_9BACL|nr:glycosyltransferase [Paenibacillus sabuli]MBD2847463.1 glycosyltransferase [Paenibacillus sabuli]